MKKTTQHNRRFFRNLVSLFILFYLSITAIDAQIKVTGIITDSNKEPLIGVNVKIKGLQIGTVSDFNGKYAIEVPSSSSVLVFSYIGYKSQEQLVGVTTEMKVVLEDDSKAIDEVVVVAYGTQKKSHLTGAVSSLKNDKLDEVPVSGIDKALQGKLAGVQILNTNPEAGSASVIRVRGMGSISASSEPLVVVDGFPSPDGLAGLSMGDVESIEVLKDAASASLYGSRAAGGVILVTTKSGSVKSANYNFKMYSGVRAAMKLPDLMNFDDYIGLLYKEAGQRQSDPSVDGTALTMPFNKITDADKGGYLIQHNYLDLPTDWANEALRKYGANQSYQLSASGGDKTMKYFISGSYNNEAGIMKKSNVERYTFRAKLDMKLSNSITLGVNISPSYTTQESPGTDYTNYARFQSWLPITHNAATAALTGKNVGDYAQPSDFGALAMSGVGFNGDIWNLDGTSNVSSSTVQNPVSQRERTSIITDNYKSQNNVYMMIDLFPGLQFKTSNSYFLNFKEYNKKELSSASGANNPNKLTRQTTLHSELLSENTLNFNKTIQGHEIGLLGGVTLQKSSNKFNQIIGTGFADENMLSYNYATHILMDSPDIDGTTSKYYTESLMSFLGRMTYAYKGKYMFSGSLRADGSSRFAEGHQWGTFPAGSIGWRASEEDFMKSFDWLSNLKVRGSYGLTGNNKIPQYSYMNLINTNNYVTGTNTGSLVPGMSSNSTSLGNVAITWEKTAQSNFGLDLGLLNSKINLSAEYYNSNTVQLLLQMPAMYISGRQNNWNNIGKVNNQGLEFELTTTNLSLKGFTWKTSANLSANRNKLLNYGDKLKEDNTGERGEIYRAEVGAPSIQFYGYKSSGVYTTFEEVAAAKSIINPATGLAFNYTTYAPTIGGLKVQDSNGDYKLDAADRQVLGTPFPDFTWGITNTFTIYDFDFSFLIQGVQGGKLINGDIYYPEQLKYNRAYTDNRFVSPQFPGDGKTVYATTTSGTDLMLSDYCLEDASYAALRDLTFGYKLPAKSAALLKLSGIRGYFSAQNLVYLMGSDYKGINPEARSNSGLVSPLKDGYQRGTFPLNRTYTVGLEINF